MPKLSEPSQPERHGGYRPEKSIQMGPLYCKPIRPAAIFKWLFGFPGWFWPWQVFFGGIALITWLYLTPAIERFESLSADWILTLLSRNLVMLVLFVSPWHFRLYGRKAQGTDYRYNNDWLAVGNPNFLFRSQLWDNTFWSVCSAVPIWTAYEALTLWLHANGIIRRSSWGEDPVYCTFVILLIPVWATTYFYATHRLLHWRPLYRRIHYIHHKNVDIGPWSGLAMHPFEHVLYFGSVIILWVVPSHPLHSIYLLQELALGSLLSHLGFARVVINGKASVDTDHYIHYLHHKHFTVNYSNDVGILPLDKWLGTFHDGSDEATEAMRARARQRARRSVRKGVK